MSEWDRTISKMVSDLKLLDSYQEVPAEQRYFEEDTD